MQQAPILGLILTLLEEKVNPSAQPIDYGALLLQIGEDADASAMAASDALDEANEISEAPTEAARGHCEAAHNYAQLARRSLQVNKAQAYAAAARCHANAARVHSATSRLDVQATKARGGPVEIPAYRYFVIACKASGLITSLTWLADRAINDARPRLVEHYSVEIADLEQTVSQLPGAY